MAVDSPKRLYGPTQPGTVAGTLYTVPALTTTIIRNIHASNVTATAATVVLSIGLDAGATRIVPNITVPAFTSYDWNGFIPMAAGEVIQGFQGTASAVTVTISGVETA